MWISKKKYRELEQRVYELESNQVIMTPVHGVVTLRKLAQISEDLENRINALEIYRRVSDESKTS